MAPDLTQTERPSDREIDFVRQFAPSESAGRALAMELSIEAVLKQAQERGKV